MLTPALARSVLLHWSASVFRAVAARSILWILCVNSPQYAERRSFLSESQGSIKAGPLSSAIVLHGPGNGLSLVMMEGGMHMAGDGGGGGGRGVRGVPNYASFQLYQQSMAVRLFVFSTQLVASSLIHLLRRSEQRAKASEKSCSTSKAGERSC